MLRMPVLLLVLCSPQHSLQSTSDTKLRLLESNELHTLLATRAILAKSKLAQLFELKQS